MVRSRKCTFLAPRRSKMARTARGRAPSSAATGDRSQSAKPESKRRPHQAAKSKESRQNESQKVKQKDWRKFNRLYCVTHQNILLIIHSHSELLKAGHTRYTFQLGCYPLHVIFTGNVLRVNYYLNRASERRRSNFIYGGLIGTFFFL